MKETEVTRYLATEVMGWPFIRKVVDGHGFEMDAYYSKDEEGWMCMPVDHDYYWSGSTDIPFDPIHNIEHAFMVRDALRDTEDYDVMEKFEDAYRNYNAFDEVWDVSAERLSASAVRATATEQQIAEWL